MAMHAQSCEDQKVSVAFCGRELAEKLLDVFHGGHLYHPVDSLDLQRSIEKLEPCWKAMDTNQRKNLLSAWLTVANQYVKDSFPDAGLGKKSLFKVDNTKGLWNIHIVKDNEWLVAGRRPSLREVLSTAQRPTKATSSSSQATPHEEPLTETVRGPNLGDFLKVVVKKAKRPARARSVQSRSCAASRPEPQSVEHGIASGGVSCEGTASVQHEQDEEQEEEQEEAWAASPHGLVQDEAEEEQQEEDEDDEGLCEPEWHHAPSMPLAATVVPPTPPSTDAGDALEDAPCFTVLELAELNRALMQDSDDLRFVMQQYRQEAEAAKQEAEAAWKEARAAEAEAAELRANRERMCSLLLGGSLPSAAPGALASKRPTTPCPSTTASTPPLTPPPTPPRSLPLHHKAPPGLELPA